MSVGPNFAQLQTDVLHKLLSEPLLSNVNMVSLRNVQAMEAADDFTKITEAMMVWTTPRNGKIGAGLIVGMPTIESVQPNVSGPERSLFLPIATFEDPTLNGFGANRVGLSAEEIVDLVEAILHQFGIEGLGVSLYPKRSVPNTDTQGVIRYDTTMVAEMPRSAIAQCAIPDLAENAGTITLTGAAGESVYYTTDGTFPGGGNVGVAILYAGPFVVAAGTTVRWAAYKAAMRGSDIGQAVIS